MHGILNPLNSGGTSFYPVSIPYSCRFDSARSCNLSRLPAASGSGQKCVFSGNVKPTKLGVLRWLFLSWNTAGTNWLGLFFTAGDQLCIGYNTGSYVVQKITSAVYRDPGSHMHVHMIVDTTQSNAEDRFQLWVNGVRVTYWNTNTNGSTQNQTLNFNQSGGNNYIGGYSGAYADFYLSEVYFLDGQVNQPSSFGQFSAQNPNVWVPKTPTGLTYGTNGFHLAFGNASALGTDTSGQGNNYTSSGLTSADQMKDTPTNNFCTMNPIGGSTSNNYPLSAYGYSTFANGNLKVGQTQGSSPWIYLEASMGIVSKTYFEVTFNTLGAVNAVGPKLGVVYDETCIQTQLNYLTSKFWGLHPASGNKYTDAASTAYGSAFSNGQVVGVAVDPIAGKIWFRNSSGWFSSGDPSTGANPAFSGMDFGKCIPVVEFGAYCEWLFNFGATAFAYTPPTGFEALCSANLPDPAIIDSTRGFDAKLYTGTGAAQNITSFNFQPDLVWLKSRGVARNHKIFDSVRGANKSIISNTTDAEGTETDALNSFLSNGFSLGTYGVVNTNAEPFIAWCWQKSVAAGFDIVRIASLAHSSSYSHSLGAAIDFALIKNLTTTGYAWYVHHKDLGAYYLSLNTTGAKAAIDCLDVNTSTQFSFPSGFMPEGDPVIAYLFRSIPGFSMFGSYTGNGNADGPFVYCGFRPRFIMVKRTDTTGDWCSLDAARDTYNGVQKFLYPSGTYAEQTSVQYDFLSNGFKLRGTATNTNTSGATYIFVAFAEAPFKYSNAR